MPYRRTNRLKRVVYRIIDAVSFNGKIRDLADSLNRKAEHSEEATPDLFSHPGGFSRAFRKRRMGIAEAYIRIARELGRSEYRKRLHALRTLMAFSLHAKTVRMPLNTARVQIEIMKEAVKNLENRRKQMEMIADFSLASYGHEAVIRRFLRELKRTEVPETGQPLRELDMGWDDHVHDNLSEGRKTPSQVVLDAFVKGISRLTIAYYDISHRETVFEAMEAGRILGVDVSVGVEFSVGPKRRRKHFMFLPPAKDAEAFFAFFETHREGLFPFVENLEENRKRRRETIIRILEDFNRTHLIRLNQGYPPESIFSLKPLGIEDVENIVPHGQYSRNHLGELLYSSFRPFLKRRVLGLKVQYETYLRLFRQGSQMSDWELKRVGDAYHATRKRYVSLSPAQMRSIYFSGKNIVDYDSAFVSERDILPALRASGGEIVYLRPLAHGLADAVSTVVGTYPYIDKIELINMRDSITRNPSEFVFLSNFVNLLNNGEFSDLEKFLDEARMSFPDRESLRDAWEYHRRNPLVPLAGSASTGWDPHIPGMGFIRESDIPRKSRKHFMKSHHRLPHPVSLMITTQGKGPARDDGPRRPEHEMFLLGKSGRFKKNLVGDEEIFEHISLGRLWRYLNPRLKNLIRVAIGVVPAYLWIGPVYTGIWLGITFVRNVFADMISASGRWPGAWSRKDINFDNATQSLFWTGFSVPILGMVKHGFDFAWPLAHSGALFEWSKFFAICIANGTYIAAHNTLRRFDSRVIMGNFFRSILAWPFASLTAPLGNLLGIPSIVQAKFWSDVVAAMIEGTGKFRQKMVLRERDLKEILPLFCSDNKEIRLTAMLDILYIWARRRRGPTCLSRILIGRGGFFSSLGRLLGRKREKQDGGKEEEMEEMAGDDMLGIMLHLFSPQRADAELSMFILEKYASHEVIVLVELVGESLVPFHDWLKKIDKKAKKGSPKVSL